MHKLIVKAIALTLLVSVHAFQRPAQNRARFQKKHEQTTSSVSMEMIDKNIKPTKKTGKKNIKASKGKKTTKGASKINSGSVKEKNTDRLKKTNTDRTLENSDRNLVDGEVKNDVESITNTSVKDTAKEEVDGTSLIGAGRRSTRSTTKSDSTETQTEPSEDK
ncbi:MAG: hypothetical protein VX737_01135 [Pseudomonadota bacterium]|nr:hypothetical protein [Pseudomonadota bacterium]